MKLTSTYCLLLIAVFTPLSFSFANQPLPLQHAKNYQQPADINNYWISEKLDGIRGYWNGTQLLTRKGHIINSPIWFTQQWPNIPLDGELWIARNAFEQTLSCVNKAIATNCWKNIKYMVFDLPADSGIFSQRLQRLREIITTTNNPYLLMVKQFTCSAIDCLYKHFDNVVQANGEGLMLHEKTAYYTQGRSKNIMKLKPSYDSEATVIEHLTGQGKYQNMLGAIKVKTPNGIIFKIGSGFSDKERQNPPAIGSVITYKYSGKTQKGVPRFASFLRIRTY